MRRPTAMAHVHATRDIKGYKRIRNKTIMLPMISVGFSQGTKDAMHQDLKL
jgi:hypothetical protein